VDCQRHALVVLQPGERLGTHFTGDWVGPRAGLDGGTKIINCRDNIKNDLQMLQFMNCVELAHSMHKWRFHVKALNKFGFHKNQNSFSSIA
jgi:hypothetical protein